MNLKQISAQSLLGFNGLISARDRHDSDRVRNVVCDADFTEYLLAHKMCLLTSLHRIDNVLNAWISQFEITAFLISAFRNDKNNNGRAKTRRKTKILQCTFIFVNRRDTRLCASLSDFQTEQKKIMRICCHFIQLIISQRLEDASQL